jgi:predicted DCC family thiol-disulfide oxidoreductase YuxK
LVDHGAGRPTLPILLVSYDAECPFCRRAADWAAARDVGGRIVLFPIQNPELLRMAPELGGLPLHEAIHAVDSSTREVSRAGGAWLQMLRRLPGLRWWALPLSLPGLRRLALAEYGRRASRGCRAAREWR